MCCVSSANVHQARRLEDARAVVLLAVDDEQRRASYAYAFAASGFEVVAPQDLDAWCASLSDARPDIIVADVRDPAGWTRVRWFKQQTRTRDVPLVALAADAGAATCARAQREQCAAVCSRTSDANVLVRGVRAVLRNSSESADRI
jgi:DNA-binding NarL/FixJ family response regulator